MVSFDFSKEMTEEADVMETDQDMLLLNPM